jgi:NAD(P)-dependent dehydrogenase (short-subunit alcohol dehydrogenase family)
MLSLISDNGKIITIGSTAGVMTFKKITNEDLKQRFRKPTLTEAGLFELLQEFEAAVDNNTYAEQGWPKWSYGVSKLGINLYNTILARNQDVVNRHIQVSVCCPGYVKTDMSSMKGHLSV